MNTAPDANDLWHVLLVAGLEDVPPSIAAELATDTTVVESSIIAACVQAGYTTDAVQALLHWQQVLGNAIVASREPPAWQATDGRTWRSLLAWLADYRAAQADAS